MIDYVKVKLFQQYIILKAIILKFEENIKCKLSQFQLLRYFYFIFYHNCCSMIKNSMHYLFLIYMCGVLIGESLDGHSGYEFSWSPYRLIPFSTSASYHNFHHSHNVGNFSSFFSLWDTIFGCNKAYYQFYERVREAKERHDRRKEEFNKALKEKLAEEELESIRNAERNQDIFQSDDKVKIE